MGLGVPPLRIKIRLESKPPKSTMLVGRLAVLDEATPESVNGDWSHARKSVARLNEC